MSLRDYLPSKQFAKIAGAIFAVGATILIAVYVTSEKSPLKNTFSERPNETYGDLVSKDTDGDGVLDWEENLWLTDIAKTDTDGDGISDKEYIDARKELLNEKGTAAADSESLTETDKFARDFFSTFMSLYQSGKRSNQTTAQIVESANQAIAQRSVPDRYAIADIHEVPDTQENKTAYINTMVPILIRITNTTGDEIELIDDILNNPGSTNAKIIQDQARLYEQAAIDMMKLSVPATVSAKHLAIANTYNKIAVASLDMSLIGKDPFRAVGGMKIFIDNQKILLDLLGTLKSYLLA